MRKFFSIILLTCSVLLLAGCTLTELRVSNETGTDIYVSSGHTKNVTAIREHATAKVPHSSGTILVVTKRDNVWRYENVTSVLPEADRSFDQVSLLIGIGEKGIITLPSGKKIYPAQTLQGQPQKE